MQDDACIILDVFRIRNRGLVVAIDRKARDPQAFSVGETVEIRQVGEPPIQAMIAGCELSTPPNPDRCQGWLLRGDEDELAKVEAGMRLVRIAGAGVVAESSP